ncbi:MAG: 2Fe-2S iron-sulfur cluster-binding protein [Sneathiella sp.]
MVQITFKTADGNEIQVNGTVGDNVMETAVSHDIDEILGECGGSMMCATCHCYVDEAFSSIVGGQNNGESEMLESAASEVTINSRLSCQIILTEMMDGLIIHLPEDQT